MPFGFLARQTFLVIFKAENLVLIEYKLFMLHSNQTKYIRFLDQISVTNY